MKYYNFKFISFQVLNIPIVLESLNIHMSKLPYLISHIFF